MSDKIKKIVMPNGRAKWQCQICGWAWRKYDNAEKCIARHAEETLSERVALLKKNVLERGDEL